MGPKVNSKAEAARARKSEHAARNADLAAAARDAELDKDWRKGSNEKSLARKEVEATKADEAARKRQEKAALLAAEEAALGSGGKVKTTVIKKNSKKATNDLSLLETTLVKDAEKNQRRKKQAELEKQQKEEQAAKERAAAKEVEYQNMDPLLRNTEAMLEGAVGRHANVQAMETLATLGTTGLDGALKTLNVAGGSVEMSQKALYLAFEERTLPVVKQQYPGLRLSQYKEKVFGMWKKSPENPHNQLPSERGNE